MKTANKSVGKQRWYIVLLVLLVMASIMPNALSTTLYAGDDSILTVTSSVAPETILVGDTTRVNIDVLGHEVVVEERRPLDIILVMDASGSMTWDMAGNRPKVKNRWGRWVNNPYFTEPNRMKFAEDAAISFIRDSALRYDLNTRVGIVSFGTRLSYGSHRYDSQIEPLKPISDYGEANSIRNAIRNPEGGTALGEPVYEAIARLNESESHNPMQVIVMMTDGEHNPGRGREPADAADYVATNGMIMHTVGFGSGIADDMLINLAYRANGSFHSAPTGASLGQVFDSLATTLKEIVAEDVVVIYELTEDVEYVPGSATVPPTSIDGRTLTWELGTITKDQTKSIAFDVRSLVTGDDVYINTAGSKVTYNAGEIELLPLEAVEVKSGEIEVDVEDSHDNDIENVAVCIKKIIDGSEVLVSSGVTDDDGTYEAIDLSSGEYRVTITTPLGYKLHPNVFAITLSPTVPTYDLEVTLAPGEIENALIKSLDVANPSKADSVANGVVNAKLSFSLLKAVDSIEIVLNTIQTSPSPEVNASFTISVGSVHKDSSPVPAPTDPITDNKITIAGGLELGDYLINLSFMLGADATLGKSYSIDIETIKTITDDDDDDVVNTFIIDDAKLGISIVEDPALY